MVPLTLNIDPSFFKEEEKSGFLVTKERKELWAVEIDLLMQLDRVCKENGLQYCVGAGTMLGAVRHKGFIPWDDDIDVYLLREDYDKLMKLDKEFEYPYFLQNSDTEKKLLKQFARLRNSRTTGHTKEESRWDINKGIFIDIFPLDGISEDETENDKQRKINEKDRKKYRYYNYVNRTNHTVRFGIRHTFRKIYVKLFMQDKEKVYRRAENNLKKYSRPGTKLWGNRTLVFECPKSRRPYEDWKDLIRMPFEFVEVPVPRKYDEMLRQQYGDYMQIPEIIGQNAHGELIISTDRAFNQIKE